MATKYGHQQSSNGVHSFGPTPVSDGPAPRAYSPVNVLGRVIGDATAFRAVRDGAPVRIIRAEA